MPSLRVGESLAIINKNVKDDSLNEKMQFFLQIVSFFVSFFPFYVGQGFFLAGLVTLVGS